MKKRRKIRIPLPKKIGGPQTSKKGKKGYNRKVEKSILRKGGKNE